MDPKRPLSEISHLFLSEIRDSPTRRPSPDAAWRRPRARM